MALRLSVFAYPSTTTMAHILIIDDERSIRSTMKDILDSVLDDDYCLSSFLVKVIDKLYGKFSSCRIKCGKRLIEEEHRNFVHKYTGECNTLFLSS